MAFLPPREIAARTGAPLATVASRLTRAHARLRARLGRGSDRDAHTGLAALAPLLDPRQALAPGAAASAAVVMSTKLKAACAVAALVVAAVIGVNTLPGPGSRDAGDADVQRDAELASTPGLEDAGPVDPGREAAEDEVAPTSTDAPEAEADAAPAPIITGVVLRPEGEPAAGATVVIGDVGALSFLKSGSEPREEVPRFETDEDGRFAISEVPGDPALVLLSAGALDAAPSPTAQVEPGTPDAPAEALLRLRVGGTVRGRVVRGDGTPAIERRVRFLQEAAATGASGKRLLQWIETDDTGHYEVRHLAPGPWGIVTFPDDEELAEIGGQMFNHMVQARCDVVDGGEHVVDLGGIPDEAVVVRGVVTAAGAPTSGGFMQWMAECDDPTGSQQIPSVGKDGTYEVTLPRPGRWWVRVSGRSGNGEFFIDVPRAEAHEHDFALPMGIVRGIVASSSGAPVSGCNVTVMALRGHAHRNPLRVADDTSTTKEDGAFEIGGLRPGEYLLGTGHDGAGHAAPVRITVAEDEALEGVQLVVQGGQRITGKVVDGDGIPVQHAPIWIHDAAGDPLTPISGTRTGEDGTFRTAPLAPGVYSVLARATRSAGVVAFAPDVRVGEDAPDPLELTFGPAATIVAEATVDGEPVRAHVRVHDLDGRIHSGLRARMDPWSWKLVPFDSVRRHLPSLPPGTYTVSAYVAGVGEGTATVTVAAGETAEVEIAVR